MGPPSMMCLSLCYEWLQASAPVITPCAHLLILRLRLDCNVDLVVADTLPYFTGIVYCFSRAECEKVAQLLQSTLRSEHGVSSAVVKCAADRAAPSCTCKTIL